MAVSGNGNIAWLIYRGRARITSVRHSRLVPVAPPGGYNIITIDDLISARRHVRRHGHAQSLRCKWWRSRRVCLVVRDRI